MGDGVTIGEDDGLGVLEGVTVGEAEGLGEMDGEGVGEIDPEGIALGALDGEVTIGEPDGLLGRNRPVAKTTPAAPPTSNTTSAVAISQRDLQWMPPRLDISIRTSPS